MKKYSDIQNFKWFFSKTFIIIFYKINKKLILKVNKKKFDRVCDYMDNLEKPDFAKIDLSDIFKDVPRDTKLKIRDDFSGVGNFKIIRLLKELESVRKKYNIELKNEDENQRPT